MIPRIMSKLETDGTPMRLIAAIAFTVVKGNAKHFECRAASSSHLAYAYLLLYYLWLDACARTVNIVNIQPLKVLV